MKHQGRGTKRRETAPSSRTIMIESLRLQNKWGHHLEPMFFLSKRCAQNKAEQSKELRGKYRNFNALENYLGNYDVRKLPEKRGPILKHHAI